jgi:large subunit ribosomal protein L4
MKTILYNQNAEMIGDVDLPDRIFGVAMNTDLVRQVLEAQSANSRQVLAHTKGRGEVHGGGRKPWKQKGTGRARHGSIRSPIWKGGGVTFGPTKERNFSKKINKKMKRNALFMALSSKVKDSELIVLENLKFESPKTKMAAGVFKILSGKMDGYKETKKKRDSILLVMPNQDKMIFRATSNLSFIDTASARNLNVKDVLANKYLVLLKDSLPVIAETFKL